MTKYTLILLSILLVIFSCKKDEEPSITINKTEIEVSGNRSAEIITFTANMDWTAKSSESWCTLSQASGDASINRVSIIADANESYDARSCIITSSFPPF